MVAALLVIFIAAFGPFTQHAIRSVVCRVQVTHSNEVSIPVAHYLNSLDDAQLTAPLPSGRVNLRLGHLMKSSFGYTLFFQINYSLVYLLFIHLTF